MAEKKANCVDCKLRAYYDKSPKSLLGRFWRWHINFCPGWKGFMGSLSDDERNALKEKYGWNK